MKLTSRELIETLKGEVITYGKEVSIQGVETDTRRLKENFIFFALKGARVDGNDLVDEAVKNGAVLCVVDKYKEEFKKYENTITIVKVENSREALYQLAQYYRGKFNIKVIGITGSTGKTSTKDILSGALSEKYKVFKTIGNYNSDIGLPLMIFKFKDEHEIAVLEMGMSGFGEIELLAKIARPDMAIITNIGESHLEQLKTRENILKAKMEIVKYFNENNILIINNDDDMLSTVADEKFEIIRCSIHGDGTMKSNILELNISESFFKITDGKFCGDTFNLKMPGEHNVSNALLTIAVCEKLGMCSEEINRGFKNIDKTSMRLDIKKHEEKGYLIINDAYNASPDSMKAAIDVMNTIHGKKICVFGTMKELGETSDELHREIGEYALKHGIEKMFVLGEYSEYYLDGFKGKEGYIFNTKEELIEKLKGELSEEHVVLIKASRSMKFETIYSELLES
ncbi:UDP-N-acetylmuramoyl-tripeptide--D-alanyl-D-alanine ligase [Oceanirhabdus sp. W0125-5]|uniref:UDP-N-acetylmuramoyl-tripeptide--D-alanyl-D- alanine ligase n=1 Tax=Oceanirhabdus sp. W0125-5 TaxID=2999116 RepID=UPI0022F2C6D9|nr:UDP-N-acetylmuramoyl-tripeptide--D-alanyl-D-alanine ligase [Oceanirhabdus sp. W0125-5]WBW95354.1 UDP-N-acetylmuramoyl-tripeptide--D-alanyl-D-alanine ligase [Oceanirhabdus sp. W0125-5]